MDKSNFVILKVGDLLCLDLYIYILITGILLLVFNNQAAAQNSGSSWGKKMNPEWSCGTDATSTSTQDNNYSIQSIGQEGGKHITADGILNTIVIFAKFPEDTAGTRSGPSFWPGNGWPSWYDDIIRSAPTNTNGEKLNITNYFQDMSEYSFHLIGNEYTVVTPNTKSFYDSSSSPRYEASKDVIQKLDNQVDYSNLDQWTKNSNYDHSNSTDGDVDMIFIVWRGMAFGWGWTGEASLGQGNSFTLDNTTIKTGYFPNASGVTINARTNRRSVFNTMKHELGHYLLAGAHPYGLEERRVWSILSPYIWNALMANPYEREKLDWIEVPEITTTTTKTLEDYLNTGDAYKIHPTNGYTGEYFYVTNNQNPSLMQGGTYDDATHDENDEGIMVLHINGDYSNFGISIRHLASDGDWNWNHIGSVTNPWDPNKDMPLFDRLGANPDDGRSLSDDVETNNGERPFITAIKQADGDTVKCGFPSGASNCPVGDYKRISTYNPDHRPLLSSITNPNTNTWDGSNSTFAMKVLSQNGDDINVKFFPNYDPYTISENTTWDGQIFLDSTITVQQGYDLSIADSTTIHQTDAVDIFNHGNLHIKDTLTLKNDMIIGGYTNGVGSPKGNVTLHENLTIGDTATVIIKQGTKLTLKDNVDIQVYGKIDFEQEVDVHMGKNSDINVWGQMLASGATTYYDVRFYGDDWNGIHFRNGSSGNRLDYAVISGGNQLVNVQSNNNNTLYKTRLKNGWRGLSSSYASNNNKSSVTLKHVIIEGNSSVGMVSYHLNPSLTHVTVRHNAQAGVWLYDSEVTHFYKSVVDSNATVDNYREGLEVINSSNVAIMDGGSQEGYTRVENNFGNEIYVGSNAGLLDLGIDCCGKIGGDNSIIANDGGYHIVNNNGTVHADYTYWEPVPPNLSGNGSVTVNQPLISDPTGNSGANGVPGSPSGPASSNKQISYPELVVSAAINEDIKRNKRQYMTSTDDDVKLLAKSDNPFELAKQGKKVLGIEKKSLTSEQINSLSNKIRNLIDKLSNDAADHPDQLLRSLYHFYLVDKQNQTGMQQPIIDQIKTYSRLLENEINLDERQRLAAEQAAMLQLTEAQRSGEFQTVDNMIKKYEPVITQTVHKQTLLLKKIDQQTRKGNYKKAYENLEQARQLSNQKNPFPTLGTILTGQLSGENKSQDEYYTSTDKDADKPSSYSLENAYPNPFNPNTTVPFTLADRANVKITVYNIMGQKVSTLTNDSYEEGYHEVKLNGSNMASGIYMIKAQIHPFNDQSFNFNQKVTLLK